MLLKHQYLKFTYVDIVLMVSKMFRGNLTAGILAIGVTVVLISEIDTNCRTISAWIWYILSMSWYKKICNATHARLPGGRNTEGNLRGFTVVMCCEKRSLFSVGVIMHVFVYWVLENIFFLILHWGWGYGPWKKARTCAISILIILPGNAVY